MIKPLGKVHSSVSFREKKLCCNAILDAVSGLIRAKSSGCNFPDPSRIPCWLEIDRRLRAHVVNIDHSPFSSDGVCAAAAAGSSAPSLRA
jgi:hypothetical protein